MAERNMSCTNSYTLFLHKLPSQDQLCALPVSVELIIKTVFTFAESPVCFSVVCADVDREE